MARASTKKEKVTAQSPASAPAVPNEESGTPFSQDGIQEDTSPGGPGVMDIGTEPEEQPGLHPTEMAMPDPGLQLATPEPAMTPAARLLYFGVKEITDLRFIHEGLIYQLDQERGGVYILRRVGSVDELI